MNTAARGSSFFRQIFTAFLFFVPALFAQAQEMDCSACHSDVTFASAAHPDLVCQDCHTTVTPEHKGADLEPLTNENSCAECHGKVLRAMGRSTHADGVLIVRSEPRSRTIVALPRCSTRSTPFHPCGMRSRCAW